MVYVGIIPQYLGKYSSNMYNSTKKFAHDDKLLWECHLYLTNLVGN